MPVYDFQCTVCRARSEQSLSVADRSTALACSCGGELRRLVGAFSLGGRVQPPAPRSHLPSSLRGVGMDRARIAEVQRAEERLSRFEERHPDFTPARMPVVSHEGPGAPIRSAGRVADSAVAP